MRTLPTTRIPVAAKAGIPLAAALLAAACGSAASSSSGTGATGGQAGTSSAGTTVTTKTGSQGTFLTDASGRAVYLFAKDTKDSSACSGACASIWSPVPASGTPTASGGAKTADLGTISRSDGTKQVTYNGHPLYYYVSDHGPGQTAGQGINEFGANWWLVAPSGTQITSAGSGSGTAPSSSTSGGYGGGY